jgi:hypothetical protein
MPSMSDHPPPVPGSRRLARPGRVLHHGRPPCRPPQPLKLGLGWLDLLWLTESASGMDDAAAVAFPALRPALLRVFCTQRRNEK